MTAATLAHLPIEFGGSLLSSAGRMALAVAARYMRAPLANTGIAALVGMSALAASNAMYMQPHAHPAPLFGEVSDPQVTSAVDPVVPMSRPADLKFGALPALPVEEKPVARPVTSTVDQGPVGNKDVFEVQRKLEVLRLFSGTIDGYYGPQTARAIKKFQDLVGLKPTGELTRDVVERIRNAPMTLGDTGDVATPTAAPSSKPVEITPPAVELAPAVQPLAATPAQQPSKLEEQAAVDPKTLAEMPPLPTPEPLIADIQTGAIQKTAKVEAAAQPAPTVLGRPVPTTAEGALQMAADTAGQAFDTIVSGVQALTSQQQSSPRPQAYVEPAKVAVQTTPQVVSTSAVQGPAGPQTAAARIPQDGPDTSANDPVFVAKVQRGLASLGFLHGPADGVAGEATAKAVRNFETYFNYNETGRISPGLLDLLVQNGASI